MLSIFNCPQTKNMSDNFWNNMQNIFLPPWFNFEAFWYKVFGFSHDFLQIRIRFEVLVKQTSIWFDWLIITPVGFIMKINCILQDIHIHLLITPNLIKNIFFAIFRVVDLSIHISYSCSLKHIMIIEKTLGKLIFLIWDIHSKLGLCNLFVLSGFLNKIVNLIVDLFFKRRELLRPFLHAD